MQINWLPIKAWWVHYERVSHVNLENVCSYPDARANYSAD